MWLGLLGMAKTVGPKVAKTLVQVWPLLNDPKAREQATKLLAPLADRRRSGSRDSRLAAVRSVIEDSATTVSSADRKETVEGWGRRADHLRLGLPLLDLGGQRVRRQRRAAWDGDFEQLVSDMLEQQSRWGAEDGGGSRALPGGDGSRR